MGSPRKLLRLKGLALPAAVLLHLVVLTALVLGFRDLPAPPPERVIEVLLVPLPRPERQVPAPPTRQIQLHRPEQVVESEVAPLVAPAPQAPPSPPGDVDLEALRLAPFSEPDRVGKALRARARCNGSSLPKTAAEWNDCPPPRQLPVPEEGYRAMPKEKESEFKRAAETKKAWRDYRNSTNPDAYPGLRCTLGRSC